MIARTSRSAYFFSAEVQGTFRITVGRAPALSFDQNNPGGCHKAGGSHNVAHYDSRSDFFFNSPACYQRIAEMEIRVRGRLVGVREGRFCESRQVKKKSGT